MAGGGGAMRGSRGLSRELVVSTKSQHGYCRVDFGPFRWKPQLKNSLCFSVFVLSAGVSQANSVQ